MNIEGVLSFQTKTNQNENVKNQKVDPKKPFYPPTVFKATFVMTQDKLQLKEYLFSYMLTKYNH